VSTHVKTTKRDQIQLRVAADEKQAITAAAAEHGLSVTAYLLRLHRTATGDPRCATCRRVLELVSG
jgi:uncharacterized protein (DUF1778 family)